MNIWNYKYCVTPRNSICTHLAYNYEKCSKFEEKLKTVETDEGKENYIRCVECMATKGIKLTKIKRRT